jgi:hypothetical protein
MDGLSNEQTVTSCVVDKEQKLVAISSTSEKQIDASPIGFFGRFVHF